MKNYLFLLAIAFLLNACSDKSKKTTNEPVQPVKAIELAQVIKERPEYTISLPGELKPYEQVKIYPKIKGFIKNIYVDRGSKVSKGQILAILDAPEIAQQYLAKKALERDVFERFQYSKQSYARLKTAAQKNGAVAPIEVDRAYAKMLGDSAALQSAQAQVTEAAQAIQYLKIIAPFEGIITARNVSAGALVGDNGATKEPLFELGQQHKLRLTIAIPEKQIHSLPAGTKAAFSVIDRPGKIYTAQLSRNSGLLDQSLRSVMAEFDVENSNQELRGGQYAKVEIALIRPDSSLWVPSSSVVQSQSGIFVLHVEDKKVKRIPVSTGVIKGDKTEIFGDIQAGNEIILKGSEEIKEGSTIH